MSDDKQFERMFMAACSDLGAINEELGLDPNDGGAEPILDAIEALRADKTALLEALKTFVFPYQEACKTTDTERQEIGRAAIAKATGAQP
jgi:hypothetical protein